MEALGRPYQPACIYGAFAMRVLQCLAKDKVR